MLAPIRWATKTLHQAGAGPAPTRQEVLLRPVLGPPSFWRLVCGPAPGSDKKIVSNEWFYSLCFWSATDALNLCLTHDTHYNNYLFSWFCLLDDWRKWLLLQNSEDSIPTPSVTVLRALNCSAINVWVEGVGEHNSVLSHWCGNQDVEWETKHCKSRVRRFWFHLPIIFSLVPLFHTRGTVYNPEVQNS